MNIKKILTYFSVAVSFAAYAQNTNERLQIIDVSQAQIRLMNACKDKDSAACAGIFADSLYKPYYEFWSGYVGEEKDFTDWMIGEAMPAIKLYNERNNAIDGTKLLKQFDEIKKRMKKLTHYSPEGKWYIVYGPAWTDLGGLLGGIMLIDLSHEHNNSNDNIVSIFPHELTHQIMSNVNKNIDTTALGPVIGEGFAVFMNQLYWKDKYSPAQNLGYTEDELRQCEMEQETIKKYFNENKFSSDKNIIDSFRNRGAHITKNLPGAIGYYIGYQIVKSYVNKHGKQSWKDVFVKTPMEIYLQSEY